MLCLNLRDGSSISYCRFLTRWGRVTHKCISKLTIIGSNNDLSPSRRQAIIWPNAGILLIGPSETKFSEILIEIDTFWFRKMHLKISSETWRPFCLGLNVLRDGSPISYCRFLNVTASDVTSGLVPREIIVRISGKTAIKIRGPFYRQ